MLGWWSPSHGMPITEYDPRSKGAKVMINSQKNFWKRMMRREKLDIWNKNSKK